MSTSSCLIFIPCIYFHHLFRKQCLGMRGSGIAEFQREEKMVNSTAGLLPFIIGFLRFYEQNDGNRADVSPLSLPLPPSLISLPWKKGPIKTKQKRRGILAPITFLMPATTIPNIMHHPRTLIYQLPEGKWVRNKLIRVVHKSNAQIRTPHTCPRVRVPSRKGRTQKKRRKLTKILIANANQLFFGP